MTREIVITPTAQKDINRIFEYLEGKWSERIKLQFSNLLNKNLKRIVNKPDLFPISENNIKFRKCVLSKQSTLYYHFNDKHIVVVAVFDTRQDPKKIKNIKNKK